MLCEDAIIGVKGVLLTSLLLPKAADYITLSASLAMRRDQDITVSVVEIRAFLPFETAISINKTAVPHRLFVSEVLLQVFCINSSTHVSAAASYHNSQPEQSAPLSATVCSGHGSLECSPSN